MLETPFPVFISEKPGEIPIFRTFLAKNNDFFLKFGLFSLKIRFLSPAMFENVIVTSYLTDFHDFSINGKRRPYPIPWYQTIILWARQSS